MFILCFILLFAVLLPGNSLSLFQLHFAIFNFPLNTNVGKVISESCYLLLENTRHSAGCQGPAAKYNRKAYLMQIIITEYYKLLTPVHLYLNSTLVLNSNFSLAVFLFFLFPNSGAVHCKSRVMSRKLSRLKIISSVRLK